MARRTKYFYNPKSLSFEKVSDHRSYVLWRRFGATSLFVVLVVGLSFVISYFYVRFNMLPNQQNNSAVVQELETVNRQIEEFEKRLQDLEDKDISIYRSIFNVAPLHDFQYLIICNDAGLSDVRRPKIIVYVLNVLGSNDPEYINPASK